MMRARTIASAGFTLLEMMVVVAIIAILALIALPTFLDRIVREQIRESMALAEVAKKGVAAAYAVTGELPVDNAAAGVPPRDKIVGNLVSAVEVNDGAVTLTYGNNANHAITGKRLTIRPAIVPEHRSVPIAWVCNNMPVPDKMQVKGQVLTDIPLALLPVECRGPAA